MRCVTYAKILKRNVEIYLRGQSAKIVTLDKLSRLITVIQNVSRFRSVIIFHHRRVSVKRQAHKTVVVYHCFNFANAFNRVVQSSPGHFYQDL